METISITIGESRYEIRPFRAFKAIHAGEIVAHASEQVQAILDSVEDFTRDYTATHRIRIPKDIAEARGFTLPEETEFIDLPAEPSNEQKVMRVFPEAFRLAKGEVMQLIALVVIDNRELQRADEEDKVGEVLTRIGKQIVYDAEVGELVELLTAAVDTVKAQIAEREEALGKLKALFSKNSPQQTPPDGGTSDTGPQQVLGYEPKIKPATISQEEPTTSAASSSTSSPEPTDGDASEPSSESDTERSPSSVTS